MNKPIVVSITTWPPRIGFVFKCLTSILNQTVKPDLIRLSASAQQFPNRLNDFPEDLKDLISKNQSIKVIFEEGDIGPFRKEIIPASKLYGNSYFLLTIDDDFYYKENYIETMLKKLGNYDEFSPHAAGVQGNQHIMRGEILLPCFWLNLTKEIVDTRINDTWITAYLVRIKANMRWEECPEIFNDLATEIEEGKKTITNCKMTGGYPIELQRKAMELSFEALRN